MPTGEQRLAEPSARERRAIEERIRITRQCKELGLPNPLPPTSEFDALARWRASPRGWPVQRIGTLRSRIRLARSDHDRERFARRLERAERELAELKGKHA